MSHPQSEKAVGSRSKASIANKLARGTHPTAFFLAALVAIGCEVVKLEDI
jgi:hypothetical protein